MKKVFVVGEATHYADFIVGAELVNDLEEADIIVFTGGYANYFAKRMKNSIFVVCNLVLMGLALIALEYDKTN